ncbi:MAG: RNA polymerase sigma factor [Terriglobales bacterium]
MSMLAAVTIANMELSDEDVVQRVLAGETELYEVVMRRYNQRLYRVALSILRNDGEAEDVMQDAYVRAYTHLHQFEHRAKFSTWLTRIAVNEALARLRARARSDSIEGAEGEGQSMEWLKSGQADPEQTASRREMNAVLEKAIRELPDSYRLVCVLRDVEEMSTAEAAEALGLSEDNIKTRLHRAHAMLRKHLYAQAGLSASNVLPFHAPRCDRVVKATLQRISQLLPRPGFPV